MIISERIFELLDEKKISQKEFSQRTGIAQSTISDWKRKKTNPTSDKIMLICEVLKVTPYELLSGTKSGGCEPDYFLVGRGTQEHMLIEQYRSLKQMDRGRILGYLQQLQEREAERQRQKESESTVRD